VKIFTDEDGLTEVLEEVRDEVGSTTRAAPSDPFPARADVAGLALLFVGFLGFSLFWSNVQAHGPHMVALVAGLVTSCAGTVLLFRRLPAGHAIAVCAPTVIINGKLGHVYGQGHYFTLALALGLVALELVAVVLTLKHSLARKLDPVTLKYYEKVQSLLNTEGGKSLTAILIGLIFFKIVFDGVKSGYHAPESLRPFELSAKGLGLWLENWAFTYYLTLILGALLGVAAVVLGTGSLRNELRLTLALMGPAGRADLARMAFTAFLGLGIFVYLLLI
jgi:hypothetical protein